jgi:hypothetical protein
VILKRSSKTAWRVIEGEAVILSLDTKVLRGLNAVGSRTWELVDGHRTMEQIVEEIVRDFEVSTEQADADVRAFVRELFDKGLVLAVE